MLVLSPLLYFVVSCHAVGSPFVFSLSLLSGDQVQSSQSPSGGEPLGHKSSWQLARKNTHLGSVYPYYNTIQDSKPGVILV